MDSNHQELHGRNFLTNIHEGMKVIDRNGKEIGEVEIVYLGGDPGGGRDTEPGLASTSASGYPVPAPIFGANTDASLPGDTIPEVVRDRLLQSGFLKVDTHGLFKKNVYVIPDMIQIVSGEEVRLAVSQEDLIEA